MLEDKLQLILIRLYLI